MRIHLDTDLGGDPDDACALAMLLGWPAVKLVGVTTAIDPGGQRAGCVAYLLGLAGRGDIDVAAGAEVSLTRGEVLSPAITDRRYWPEAVEPRPSPPGAALDALAAAAEAGATIVTIGPVTNLAALEMLRPGILEGVKVVAMGGWVDPLPCGYPRWGPERDFNFQWDSGAALRLASSGADLTLVPISATVRVPLRGGDLVALRSTGALGRLLADQSEAYALDSGKAGLARRHDALPADLVNFHHDPLACAVAGGWAGARVERRRLRAVTEEGLIRFEADPRAPERGVAVEADAGAFSEFWMARVRALASKAAGEG